MDSGSKKYTHNNFISSIPPGNIPIGQNTDTVAEIQSSLDTLANQAPPPGVQVQDNEGKETSLSHSGIRSLSHEIIFVGIICIAQFSTQVALGQTLNLLHVIGTHFGLHSPGQLSWLIAGYSLTVKSFILIAGRLGDFFGYKRVLILGFVWFSL